MIFGHETKDPPKDTESFIGQVIIINHPGEIKAGYTPVVYIHNMQVACRFEQITKKINRRNGKVIEENPASLKRRSCDGKACSNQAGRC